MFVEIEITIELLHGSEYHWKINVIDDLEEDTMEFDYMKKYVFRPDLSNNLTGEEVITTLHPGLFKKCSPTKINHVKIFMRYTRN